MQDPLKPDDPDVWSSMVTAANPASLLVAIAWRMGPELRSRLEPDDIFQEMLLKAWQARMSLQWQGTPSFRRWLLRIAEHCIEDHRDHFRSQKRSHARTAVPIPRSGSSSDASGGPRGVEPWGSTTPSRIAAQRELATAMESALGSLPEPLREVVRLRLFDDLLIEEIAERLDLGESAVRHRFRKGAELYREQLRRVIGTSFAGEAGGDPARAPGPGVAESGDASGQGFR